MRTDRLFAHVVVAALALLAMATAANASVTTSWRFYGSSGGYNTYFMYQTSTTDWTNARIVIDLTSGSLKHLTGGFPPPPRPQPGALGYNDTGGLCPNGAPISVTEWYESPTHFILSWGDTATGEVGKFLVFVLTLSTNANGSIPVVLGYDVDTQGVGNTTQWIIDSFWPLYDVGPLALSWNPYNIEVGQPLTLDASASTGGQSFAWDLDNNGSYETDAGSNAVYQVSYSYLQSLGLGPSPQPYPITLKVTQSGGMFNGFTDTCPSRLWIVPEPATMALLAFGALGLPKRKEQASQGKRS